MTCRVRVDTTAGVIELEGEASFVSSFFEKLLPLIERSGFGVSAQETTPGQTEDPDFAETDAAAVVPKPKKKKRANPPAGTSCRSRINTLRADGFFKDQRTPTDIVNGLKKKGWVHNANQVGAALTLMFSKGEIQRTSDGGTFTYYWDRD